jgi:transcriptional regulator with XRE-family HTH domain
MAVSEFGARLRDLRKKANMNQREVAEKVKIDFTYLSKIESGVMSPPSEEVIIKLAKVLNADKDELIALAGKFPSDLTQKLSDKDTLRFLRSSDFRESMREFKRKEKE